MIRLTAGTLDTFVRDSEIAVLMFGAPLGEATMDQATEFADAWATHRGQARFGYVDAFENTAVARSFAVRVLPTTLVLRQGEVVARLDGRCAGTRITTAIRAANAPLAVALRTAEPTSGRALHGATREMLRQERKDKARSRIRREQPSFETGRR